MTYGRIEDMNGQTIARWSNNQDIMNTSNQKIGSIKDKKIYDAYDCCIGSIFIKSIRDNKTPESIIGWINGMEIEDKNKNVVIRFHGEADIAAAAAVLSGILTEQTNTVATPGIATHTRSSSNNGSDDSGVSIGVAVICVALCLGLCLFIYNTGIIHSMLNLLEPDMNRGMAFRILSCVAIGTVGIFAGNKIYFSIGYGIGAALLAAVLFALCISDFDGIFTTLLNIFAALLMLVGIAPLTIVGLVIGLIAKMIFEVVSGNYRYYFDLDNEEKKSLKWSRIICLALIAVIFFKYSDTVWNTLLTLEDRKGLIIDNEAILTIAKLSAMISVIPMLIWPKKSWNFSTIVTIAIALCLSQFGYRMNHGIEDSVLLGNQLIMNCLMLALYLPVPMSITAIVRKIFIDKLIKTK